jgi:hypothetical protein
LHLQSVFVNPSFHSPAPHALGEGTNQPTLVQVDEEDQANAVAEFDEREWAVGLDFSFNSDDAWNFLRRWRNAMDNYGEECKKTSRLEEELAAKDAVLQCTEDALAAVKQQLAESDVAVVGNPLALILISFFLQINDPDILSLDQLICQKLSVN